MTTIGRSDVLRGLSTILRLTGRTAPSEVDLSSPVQPVYDVSGMAQEGSVIYYGESVAITTSATSRTSRSEASIRAVTEVAEALQNAGLVGSDSDIWLCGIQAFVQNNEANFSGMGASATMPGTDGQFIDNGGTDGLQIMLGWGNYQQTTINPSITAGVDDRIPVMYNNNVISGSFNTWRSNGNAAYPLRISQMNWLVVSTGASVTCRFDSIYAFAPSGVVPRPWTIS